MFSRTPDIAYSEELNLRTDTNVEKVTTDTTTAKTKGPWTEMLNPVSERCNLLEIGFTQPNVTDFFLVDIGIGTSAGSITPIAENLLHGAHHAYVNTIVYRIPCNLPKGTKIWARAASNGAIAGKFIRITCTAHYGGGYSQSVGGGIVTMGADTVNMQGTTVDPGATANTRGAWVQMSASTPDTFKGLQVGLGVHPTDTTVSYFRYAFYIGIGSAGSVTQVAGPLWSLSDNVADCMAPAVLQVPVQVPKGTGLYVACQADDTTAGQRERSVILYGIRA